MGFTKCINRDTEVSISTAVSVNTTVILAETSKFLKETTPHHKLSAITHKRLCFVSHNAVYHMRFLCDDVYLLPF